MIDFRGVSCRNTRKAERAVAGASVAVDVDNSDSLSGGHLRESGACVDDIHGRASVIRETSIAGEAEGK